MQSLWLPPRLWRTRPSTGERSQLCPAMHETCLLISASLAVWQQALQGAHLVTQRDTAAPVMPALRHLKQQAMVLPAACLQTKWAGRRCCLQSAVVRAVSNPCRLSSSAICLCGCIPGTMHCAWDTMRMPDLHCMSEASFQARMEHGSQACVFWHTTLFTDIGLPCRLPWQFHLRLLSALCNDLIEGAALKQEIATRVDGIASLHAGHRALLAEVRISLTQCCWRAACREMSSRVQCCTSNGLSTGAEQMAELPAALQGHCYASRWRTS